MTTFIHSISQGSAPVVSVPATLCRGTAKLSLFIALVIASILLPASSHAVTNTAGVVVQWDGTNLYINSSPGAAQTNLAVLPIGGALATNPASGTFACTSLNNTYSGGTTQFLDYAQASNATVVGGIRLDSAWDQWALRWGALGSGVRSDMTYILWQQMGGGGDQTFYVLGFTSGLYCDSKIGIGVAPTTTLHVVSSSATDPLADDWTVYPCDRGSKEIITGPTNWLERFASLPVYNWRRTAKVSDADTLRSFITNISGRAVTNKFTEPEFLARKAVLTAAKQALPKFAARRVGVMLDDPGMPEEICTGGDPRAGIDLLGYIGFLHAALKQEVDARKSLESRLAALEKLTKP